MTIDWRGIEWFDEILLSATGRSSGFRLNIEDVAANNVVFVAGNSRETVALAVDRARDHGWLTARQSREFEPSYSATSNVFAAGLGVMSPVLGLAAALGELGRQLVRAALPSENPTYSDIYNVLDALTHQATAQGYEGAVLALRLGQTDADYEVSRFATFTSRIGRVARMKLLLIVDLENAPASIDEVDATDSLLVQDAAALVGAGQAVWRGIPALTIENVRSALTVSIEIARSLVTLSAGVDSHATAIWSEWTRRSRGLRLTGPELPKWSVRSAILRNWSIRRWSSDAIDALTEVLQCAGLFQTQFALGLILDILGQEEEPTRTFLHSLAENAGAAAAILEYLGEHEVLRQDASIEARSAYAFIDPLVKHYFVSSVQNPQSVAASLALSFGSTYLPGDPLEGEFAHLLRLSGEREAAAHVESSRRTRLEDASLVIDAQMQVALSRKYLWSDTTLAHELYWIANKVRARGNPFLAIEVGLEAIEVLARAGSQSSSLAGALVAELGFATEAIGDKTSAVRHFESAKRILEQRSLDSDPMVLRGLALTYFGAWGYQSDAEAEQLATQTLYYSHLYRLAEHSNWRESTQFVGRGWLLKGKGLMSAGISDVAVRRLRLAAKFFSEADDYLGEIDALFQIAVSNAQQGYPVEALNVLDDALQKNAENQQTTVLGRVDLALMKAKILSDFRPTTPETVVVSVQAEDATNAALSLLKTARAARQRIQANVLTARACMRWAAHSSSGRHYERAIVSYEDALDLLTQLPAGERGEFVDVRLVEAIRRELVEARNTLS